MRRFSQDEVAQERLKIIKYYVKYGERTTKEAFEVGRGTIFVWRKRLNLSAGRITSLIPLSTKPHNFRVMATDPKIFEYIKALRMKYPRLGKEKIYPLLASYCQKEGLISIKESTIGKVIKRNNLYYQKTCRMYHNPASKYATTKRLKEKRLRIKYAPRHTDVGH
ncbi:MAG: hypothetical protein NTV24_03695, partial [Candidatus Woesebacteria bacterium]|nr:hypothetical protein [Candidatus Woesebacteria bacterium]